MTPLFLLAALILLNGFFSASEIALISLNDKKIQSMAEDGHLKAIKLRKNPQRTQPLPGHHPGWHHPGRLPGQRLRRI